MSGGALTVRSRVALAEPQGDPPDGQRREDEDGEPEEPHQECAGGGAPGVGGGHRRGTGSRARLRTAAGAATGEPRPLGGYA